MNTPPANPYAPPVQIEQTAAARESVDPHQKPSRARYGVAAFLCAAAAVAYMSRNCIGVAEDAISSELGLNEVQMGWVMSAFFWSYAAAQIPSGWIAHTWGVRRALSLFAVLWSATAALAGLAGGFWTLVAAQMLFGAAQAGVFPCAADAISKWIPAARRALASGSLASCMSLGGAAGAALAGLLLSATGWRLLLVLFALPGIVWALLFYRWFRNRPEAHAAVNDAELALIRGPSSDKPAKHTTAPLRESTPWGAIAANRDMWFICGQQFFRAAGYIFFATWFPGFLRDHFGVSTRQSGLLTSLPLLGVVGGGVVGGLVVDWVYKTTGSRRASRQGTAIVAMLMCAAFIFAAYFVRDALPAVGLISAGSFFAALGGSCGYTVTIDKAGPHVAPVFGAMNMSGNFGAALCPIVVGVFFAATSDRSLVLLFFVGIYVAAAVCWALLNPSGLLVPPAEPPQQHNAPREQ